MKHVTHLSFFHFVPNTQTSGGGQGEGGQENRSREEYVWRERKGREAGILRGREAGEKYKTLTYFTIKIFYYSDVVSKRSCIKGERFANGSTLHVKNISNPLKPFHYTQFSPVATHQESTEGLIKEEALRPLRTNSLEKEFETKISHFKI